MVFGEAMPCSGYRLYFVTLLSLSPNVPTLPNIHLLPGCLFCYSWNSHLFSYLFVFLSQHSRIFCFPVITLGPLNLTLTYFFSSIYLVFFTLLLQLHYWICLFEFLGTRSRCGCMAYALSLWLESFESEIVDLNS